MKHPVKTLAALAILGAVAPSAHAVSLKDDVLSITPQVRLQTRAQISDATVGVDTATANPGDEYRVNGGVSDAVNDSIDFSLRRARLGLAFKYGANWKGQFTVMADNVDRSPATTTAGAVPNRGVEIRYAWVERGFDLGDGMAFAAKFGLDKAEQNPTDRLSSSRKLLPNDNASSGYLNPRGVGLGVRFNHPIFLVAADFQNNTQAAAKDTTVGDQAEADEGFYYGVRAEFSFSPDWFIAKRADSFLGKEGHGLNIGLSYGTNADAVIADVDPNVAGNQAGKQSLSAYGVDAMLWLNGLSAFAEYRAGKLEADANVPADAEEYKASFITLQAGYAFLVGDEVLEPAIRYQIIDNNTDEDEEIVNFGNNAESGASGTQIDIGLNYYLSGHDNKLSLAVSLWEAEEGEGDATIIRLQHQINF